MTYPHHRGALHFLTKAKKAIDSERETPKMASKKKKSPSVWRGRAGFEG